MKPMSDLCFWEWNVSNEGYRCNDDDHYVHFSYDYELYPKGTLTSRTLKTQGIATICPVMLGPPPVTLTKGRKIKISQQK